MTEQAQLVIVVALLCVFHDDKHIAAGEQFAVAPDKAAELLKCGSVRLLTDAESQAQAAAAAAAKDQLAHELAQADADAAAAAALLADAAQLEGAEAVAVQAEPEPEPEPEPAGRKPARSKRN